MITWGSSTKICATCSLWGGMRDLGKIVPAPFVRADANARGRCLGGGYPNLDMAPGASCSKYVKWPALS